MDLPNLPQEWRGSPWIPLILGVGSHVFYFRHGEHHTYAMLYLQLAVFFPPLYAFILYNATNIGLLASMRSAIWTESWYMCSVWASIIVYRCTSLHRLHSFPGPFAWRVSKFSQSWANRGMRGYKQLDSLHDTYGEYVGTGKPKAV